MRQLDLRSLLPAGLVVDDVSTNDDAIQVLARSTSASASCPCCGSRSRHVHSHYRRHLADLPAHGFEVVLVVDVRRFRCCSPRCHQSIFSERLRPDVARPWGRRTARMQKLVRRDHPAGRRTVPGQRRVRRSLADERVRRPRRRCQAAASRKARPDRAGLRDLLGTQPPGPDDDGLHARHRRSRDPRSSLCRRRAGVLRPPSLAQTRRGGLALRRALHRG